MKLINEKNINYKVQFLYFIRNGNKLCKEIFILIRIIRLML